MRILVVDDEARIARHVSTALIEAGHDPVVAHDGEEAIGRAQEDAFDLIILDVGLPGLDGFGVLKQLRSRHVTSRVIMLTARGEVTDRVTGLQLGADDYLAKPFAMQELIARVAALGRRFIEQPAVELKVADLSLNLVDHTARRGNRGIDLSARELTLLRVLMREPGRTFTRTELCERVWEREHEYDMKLVEVFVGRLRKKIGEPQLIHTVRHVGYTLREPASA
ncbi:MAG TPA: response regulator transcription factor [Chthoniobacterales bacterium]|nr:response regulator transcription factor [Chthoniobacterales bacterium]